MLIDSHVEKKPIVHTTLGLPRWHKRIQYYLFKIRYLQLNLKRLLIIPNQRIRYLILSNKFTEFESFDKTGFKLNF